ncbi:MULTISPECIES: helix-turn-helix domain-containing protein [unclassified Paenibacillus]|uniref:helix-turn-helix domain-containing protein n=1 Tax=unclassified Paenibacillus TaxID=185978 RepID=UPI003631E274
MYPQYLFEYPNIDTDFPFHMKKKRYTSVPSHRHDFIELSFVLKGKGTEWINGTAHDMLPGTIVLLLPYQIHKYHAAEDEPLLMYICNFDMKLVTAGPESAWGLHELLLGRDETQPAYIQLQGKAYEDGVQLWDRLYQEYESSLAWRPIMLRALLLEALSQFIRNMAKQDKTPARTQHPASTKGIWPVVQYVYDHYLEPLSLNTLSEQFHIHPAQLSTQFGEAFGIYFVDFLHELRIRHACSLLISSDLPISQVAFESGFSSYPTFSRTFHRIKGITPSQYRQKKGLLR